MHKIEKDERNFQFSPTDDVFVIASLLKVSKELITFDVVRANGLVSNIYANYQNQCSNSLWRTE